MDNKLEKNLINQMCNDNISICMTQEPSNCNSSSELTNQSPIKLFDKEGSMITEFEAASVKNELLEIDLKSDSLVQGRVDIKEEITEIDLKSDLLVQDQVDIKEEITEIDLKSDSLVQDLVDIKEEITEIDLKSGSLVLDQVDIKEEMTEIDLKSNSLVQDEVDIKEEIITDEVPNNSREICLQSESGYSDQNKLQDLKIRTRRKRFACDTSDDKTALVAHSKKRKVVARRLQEALSVSEQLVECARQKMNLKKEYYEQRLALLKQQVALQQQHVEAVEMTTASWQRIASRNIL